MCGAWYKYKEQESGETVVLLLCNGGYRNQMYMH